MNTAITTAVPAAIKQMRADLTAMEQQFTTALPPHIPAARFARVAMTAIQNNPKLLRCSRQSLFNALMRCAQDGLLPDGREAAIVPFGENEDGQRSADAAQYLPMIAGIRKKVRNAGVLVDWNVQIVHAGDKFAFRLGDEPYIHHEPAMSGGRTRPVIAAYSIATYPDGTISREVMNADQIEDVRKKSRAKRGPWSDPVFYPEMCRKTVAKLHAKQLPMSTDLDRVLHRDDELYDFKGAREDKKERPGSAAAALEWFAEGEKNAPASEDDAQTAASTAPPAECSPAPPAEAGAPGVPRTVEDYDRYARAIIDEATDATVLNTWFRSEDQRKLRNHVGVTRETFAPLEKHFLERIAELK